MTQITLLGEPYLTHLEGNLYTVLMVECPLHLWELDLYQLTPDSRLASLISPNIEQQQYGS